MQPKTPLFTCTSGSQHPPRFGHAVYLGAKELSHSDGTFEYPLHMLGLGDKKNYLHWRQGCMCNQIIKGESIKPKLILRFVSYNGRSYSLYIIYVCNMFSLNMY